MTRRDPRMTALVAFTIATDGPEMMRTHLRDEFELRVREDQSEHGRGICCGDLKVSARGSPSGGIATFTHP